MRKNSKFCCFLEHGGKGVNVFKFCSIDLMKTRLMLHLRHEMVYSAYFPVLEVNKTSPRRFKQQQRASNSGGVITSNAAEAKKVRIFYSQTGCSFLRNIATLLGILQF